MLEVDRNHIAWPFQAQPAHVVLEVHTQEQNRLVTWEEAKALSSDQAEGGGVDKVGRLDVAYTLLGFHPFNALRQRDEAVQQRLWALAMECQFDGQLQGNAAPGDCESLHVKAVTCLVTVEGWLASPIRGNWL